MLHAVKVGKRYQVVIPADIRRGLGIKEGDELFLSVDKDRIIFRIKPKSWTEFGEGLHREVWSGMDTTQYLKGERQSWDKE